MGLREEAIEVVTIDKESCVYISRTCGESLAIIWYDITRRINMERSITKLRDYIITWYFYKRDIGFYDYTVCDWKLYKF